MKNKSFTLIELLMVIAIIAILSGLLLPALMKSKEMSHTIDCLSHERQLSLAQMNYINDYDHFIRRGYLATGDYRSWVFLSSP